MNVPRSHLKQSSLPADKVLRGNPRRIEVAAEKVFIKILEPLAAFALNCGLSVNDVNSIFRQAAVRSVAARQIEDARRVNVSGISATTGVSRAEISKVLHHVRSPKDQIGGRSQKVTSRILAAWQSDPKFLTANGRPTKIKLYGRGPTFETLVKTYGRGIPVRAILDELLRIDAIELKSGQEIRPKSFAAVDRRFTHRHISALGHLVSNFLSSTLHSVESFDPPMIISKESAMKFSTSDALAVKTEASAKASALLTELKQMLISQQERSRISDHSNLVQLSVTVVFTRESPKRPRKDSKNRQNFRREGKS